MDISGALRQLLGPFALLVWLACMGTAHGQGTCQAPILGTPCIQSGSSDFAAAEPQLNLGIGNPIHLATGNKHQYEIDLPARPQDPFPGFSRYYNAMDPRPGVLGVGWQIAVDTRLVLRDRQWQVIQADGSRIVFGPHGGPSVPSGSGSLHKHGAGHQWVWPGGTRLSFDAHGGLVRRHTPGTPPIVLARHTDGALTGAIRSIAQGRQIIELDYELSGPQAVLSHIQTPAGRFSYHYDHPAGSSHPRLTGVVRPDGMQRDYLYEPTGQSGNVHALTGIALRMRDGTVERIHSWAYDAQGRASTSIPGPPGSKSGRLDIEYLRSATPSRRGRTRVRQASGETTDFDFSIMGGRYMLLSVQGAPCPACAAPDTQAQYDAQGRLIEINGTRIRRDQAGRIERMMPSGSGWPGLVLRYDPLGRRHAWQSTLSGLTETQYDRRHRPAALRYANGDTLSLGYDSMGRPTSVEARHGESATLTHLAWQGRRLTGIGHPEENEARSYDAQGRLVHRAIERPAAGIQPGGLRYAESFDYDARHRLIRHSLPEGGALHYEWGTEQQLIALTWEDSAGRRHPVIHMEPGQGGYRYGNGLRLATYADTQARTNTLVLSQGDVPIWLAQRSHDAHGRLVDMRHDMPEAGLSRSWRYRYDSSSRLIGVRGALRDSDEAGSPRSPVRWDSAGAGEQAWLAWSEDGALLGRRAFPDGNPPSTGGSSISAVPRDASGLPTEMEGLALEYGAQRRLTRVTQDGQLRARYAHNAYGHQIRRHTPEVTTELFYLDNRLAAEWNHAPSTFGVSIPPAQAPVAVPTRPSPTPLRISRRYLYAQGTPVGFIDWSAPAGPQLFAIHSDLLGAPRMVTDATQAVRWLADYTTGGAAQRLRGDLDLDLRLPGQTFDAATGWHDNIFRTYDPRRMHYLEPDPLGPLPGHQALGYAAQQAARYVDPLGLLLMAFDGTRNDRQTGSNIWKLSQYYQDGPAFYHSGPGNEAYLDWDALTAWQAGQTIRTQWQSLMNALSQASRNAQSVPIDILGFSRGAALARHFANEITRHTRDGWFSHEDPLRGTISLCVDLRFMGLFETVAQFGLLGMNNAAYDLSISAAWQWVAHAVAAHERRGLFPLVSADPQGHVNTVEAAFIGAHADIGGGVLFDDDGQALRRGDLSDVALNWMLWQARAASVNFSELTAADRLVSEAILHDERTAISRVLDGDRNVQDSRGLAAILPQGGHPRLGERQRREFEQYIRRVDNWRLSSGSEVGEVDMQAYGEWLESVLGLPGPKWNAHSG